MEANTYPTWQPLSAPEAVLQQTATQSPADRLAAVNDFKSLRIRSLLTVRWLYFGVVLALAVLALDVWELSLIGDPAADLETLDSVDTWNTTVSLVQVIAYLIGAVIFIVWFFRAYSNLPSLLVRDPRYKKGWAIGSWFVPILNLFRPKQIANDAWRAGDPDASIDGSAWRRRPVSPLLHWWWALWLIGEIAGRIPAGLDGDAESYSEFESAYTIDAVAQGFYVVGGVLAILVVKRLTARQEARAAEIRVALAAEEARAVVPAEAPAPAGAAQPSAARQ